MNNRFKYFVLSAFICLSNTNAVFASDEVQSIEIKVAQPVPLVTVADKPVQKLADIKKVFVATLGTERGAELIRQRIINQLTESGHIVVVESPEDSDATFNGFARLHRYSLYDDLVTSGEAVVRLTGKEKQILWTDDVSLSKFPGYGSANKMSSNIANKIVQNLTKAIELGNK